MVSQWSEAVHWRRGTGGGGGGTQHRIFPKPKIAFKLHDNGAEGVALFCMTKGHAHQKISDKPQILGGGMPPRSRRH